jgi:hypothetical protein
VLDIGILRVTLEEIWLWEGDFLMSNRFSATTPILSAVMVSFAARQEQEQVRVTAQVSYNARFGLGWLARAKTVPRLRHMMDANLHNLKNVLEG